jgi:hypothetical protein
MASENKAASKSLKTQKKTVIYVWVHSKRKTKLPGLSPRANYTDLAIAACWRS